jgi:tRNA-splicing endonuclease subunit sen54 N-term
MDFEATEDPLKNSLTLKIVDEEEEEGGAGVDYRRIFKGYANKLLQRIHQCWLLLAKTGNNSKRSPKEEKRTLNQMEPRNRKAFFKKVEMRCMPLSLRTQDCNFFLHSTLLIYRKQGAACGVWIEEYEMTHVPQALSTGSWFQHIGVGGPSGNWLLPEETLLMVSSGRMDLLDEDGFEMGLLGTWGACIEPAGGVNKYLVRHFYSSI